MRESDKLGYWGSVGIVKDPVYQARMERAGIGSIEPKEGMEVLEKLLNGPLDQLALIKTLKADALGQLGEINTNEWIESYPQSISSKSLHNLENVLSKQPEKWDQITATGGLESLEMEELLYKLLVGILQPFWESPTGVLARYDRWMQESFSVLSGRGLFEKK